jgi:hypothetical protein
MEDERTSFLERETTFESSKIQLEVEIQVCLIALSLIVSAPSRNDIHQRADQGKAYGGAENTPEFVPPFIC